jgi:hypothetical protein
VAKQISMTMFLAHWNPWEPVAWHIWLYSARKDLVERPHEYSFAGSCTGRKTPTAWSRFNWCPPRKRRDRRDP